MLYVPGSTPLKEYVPVEVDTVSVLTFVATFVSVIVTPGTTAPVGSRAVPVIPPVAIWALRLGARVSDNKIARTARHDAAALDRRYVFMFIS
jgi:hypothetical protein